MRLQGSWFQGTPAGCSSNFRSRAALTLVELLVVLSILTMLFAMLLPGLSQARSRARSIQCVNNLKQLGVAQTLFVQSHQEYPLFQNLNPSDARFLHHKRSWSEALIEEQGQGRGDPTRPWSNEGIWRCPSARWDKNSAAGNPDGIRLSYGYNYRGLNSPGNNGALGLGGRDIAPQNLLGLSPPVREADVVAPVQMLSMGDAFADNSALQRPDWSVPAIRTLGVNRHRSRVNVLLCDGHVESVSAQSIFEAIDDASLKLWNRDNLPHREMLGPMVR